MDEELEEELAEVTIELTPLESYMLKNIAQTSGKTEEEVLEEIVVEFLA